MARPKSVNTYRHRKNKHITVHLWQRPDGTVKTYVVDTARGRVFIQD